MIVSIKATNFKLTPALQEFIEEKLNRDLERFVPRMEYTPKIWVEVGKVSEHHRKGDVFRAEAQIDMPGQAGVRAAVEGEDLHVAIDQVRDDLKRQLVRYRDKRDAENRRGARSLKKFLNLSPLARFKRKGKIRG